MALICTTLCFYFANYVLLLLVLFQCYNLVKWQIHLNCFNPLRAKFLRENINIYLHFMSFLHTNKTQVAEIPPGVRRSPAYST